MLDPSSERRPAVLHAPGFPCPDGLAIRLLHLLVAAGKGAPDNSYLLEGASSGGKALEIRGGGVEVSDVEEVPIVRETEVRWSSVCPVCMSLGPFAVQSREGYYSMLQCPECRSSFAGPLEVPAGYYENHFYEGLPGAALEAVRTRRQRLWTVRLGGITWPVAPVALRRLREVLPPGAVILDVGCGLGGFLALAEEAGFQAFGMEISRQALAFLRRLGFRVAEGDVNAYPPDWPRPRAVTAFEVIEHLPDPVGFLRMIRERFPEALLVVSTPSPRSWMERVNVRFPWDWPPNHLIRWSERGLRTAFEAAGYQEVDIVYPPMNGSEIAELLISLLLNRAGVLMSGTNSSLATRRVFTAMVQRFYYPLLVLNVGLCVASRVMFAPIAWLGNKLGWSHSSCVLVAYP